MKKILITGSSRGIGRATALAAAKKGYKVIVHGRTDSEDLKSIHSEIPDAEKVYFDVSDKRDVHDKLADFGDIDVLINNAGIARNFINDIQDVDDEKALDEYKVNVLGTIHCIQAVLPRMLNSKGCSIVNVSSIKGVSGLATMSTFTYAPAKAGVISITKALAKSYPSIRFNVVSPGYVETDQVEDWNEETFKRINDGTILGRMAQPEEVANLLLFLASDEASYLTGSEILIDGGYSLKGK